MSAAQTIDVACRPTDGGWTCDVRVGDDPGATRHEVTVEASVLERLAPGAVDPAALVRASFAFLLEREPRESILRRFDLSVIGRYFPEYEREIVRRRASG
ncbi:MAG TPA: hypothetical protein VFH63_06160 [candidate division Zixibacteria bacterium]|nr:hypothetical protein [candidate division Zixibacteria bacterium]